MLSKSAVCKTVRCNTLFYEDIKKGQYLYTKADLSYDSLWLITNMKQLTSKWR